MEPMNELKVGNDVHLRSIVKSVNADEPLWYAQVRVVDNVLTFNMLHCVKDYKKCIHISYQSLDFVQKEKTEVTMEQPYMLLILYCQYHVCWCHGDSRSQRISRHGFDQISQNIRSIAPEELTYWSRDKNGIHFAEDIFKLIFFFETCVKFVPKCPVNNRAALVQIMAWYWTCEKPLYWCIIP